MSNLSKEQIALVLIKEYLKNRSIASITKDHENETEALIRKYKEFVKGVSNE